MNALEIDDVYVRFGRNEVLRGVSLRIAAGEWFCLLGPNGVGKSTLLQCLSGHVTPAQGGIRIAGVPLSASQPDAKRHLGFACAPDRLPGLLSGRQCLEVYALAKACGIDPDVLSLAEALRFMPYLDQYVDTYSLGTRQKLCVLLALLGRPKLIVLDEAFNGLDPRSAQTLRQELERRLADGCSVLLATHSLDIVERHADRAALMMSGRIVHEWGRDELAQLRDGHGDLEAALAAVSDPDEPRNWR